MEINDIELFAVEIPRTDGGPAARSLLLSLTTDSGVEGWGEAPLAWRAEELTARRESLQNALVGRSVYDRTSLAAVEPFTDARLACALNIAMWDAAAKAAGQPLFNLWGGAYRQHVPLAIPLPPGDIEQTANLARELAEQGYRFQVLTGDGSVETIVHQVQAIRAASGRVELAVDAGGQFEMSEARSLALQLHRVGAGVLIDPLSQAGSTALLDLARQTLLPLACRDGLKSPSDVLDAVRSGASRLILDLFQHGGPGRVQQSTAIAEAARLPVALAVPGSVGIATAAALHLAAACPAMSAEHISDFPQLADNVLAEKLSIADGLATVPQGAGLGVTVDRAKVERFRAK